jgi:hypothetical protein
MAMPRWLADETMARSKVQEMPQSTDHFIADGALKPLARLRRAHE